MADFENWWASTVILRVNSPAPRILSPSPGFLTTPSSTRRSRLNTSPSSFSRRPRLTMAHSFLKMLVKPRLGRRRCRGIWPPSKPRFCPKPVPARCPFDPRVEVLPWPDPMPRPMRLRAFFCPAGGLNPLRFIVELPLLHYFQQMRNLLHHAAENRRIGPLHHLVDLPQSQALHNPLVLLRSADGAVHQFDSDLAFH